MQYNNSSCYWYKICAIIILIVGLILGIVFGCVFSETSEVIYDEVSEVESFNTMLMFSTWLSAFVLFVFIFGIYSVCSRLDVIVHNTYKSKSSRASKSAIVYEEQDYDEIKPTPKDEDNKADEDQKFIWE